MGVYDSQLTQILEDAGVITDNMQACIDAINILFSPSASLITVQEWEAQKGVAYPDTGAVYVKWYDPATGYPNPGQWWDVSDYGSIKNDRNVYYILVANSDTVPDPGYDPDDETGTGE